MITRHSAIGTRRALPVSVGPFKPISRAKYVGDATEINSSHARIPTLKEIRRSTSKVIPWLSGTCRALRTFGPVVSPLRTAEIREIRPRRRITFVSGHKCLEETFNGQNTFTIFNLNFKLYRSIKRFKPMKESDSSESISKLQTSISTILPKLKKTTRNYYSFKLFFIAPVSFYLKESDVSHRYELFLWLLANAWKWNWHSKSEHVTWFVASHERLYFFWQLQYSMGENYYFRTTINILKLWKIVKAISRLQA